MKQIVALVAALVAMMTPGMAVADACANMVGAYQNDAMGLTPPIFDGYDVSAGQPLDYSASGISASLSCTPDGGIWNFELQMTYTDPNARARTSLAFSYALQALGAGLDPDAMLSPLMTAAARNVVLGDGKAVGDAQMQVGSSGYTAHVEVEQHADDTGILTLWIAPSQQ